MAHCPICKKSLPDERDAALGVFCSQRCKLVDLGNWLGGTYKIAGDERVAPPGHREDHDED